MKKIKKILLPVFAVVVMAATLSTSAIEASAVWKSDEKGYWWQESDGTYPKNEWKKISGSWYYFDGEGYRVTGLHEIDGYKFFFHEDGKMAVGWTRIDDGTWEYFALYGSDTVPQGSWMDRKSYETGTLKGVDVSRYQGDIDWEKVKADDISFAIIKAGGYRYWKDAKFEYNISEANRLGIPVGVYYYCSATSVEEARRQAQFCLNLVKGYTISYPIAVDIEDKCQTELSKELLGELTKAFCDEISAAGYTPILYCSQSWLSDYIDMSYLNEVDRWVANYAGTYNKNYERQIWQCSSSATIDGIDGDVDLNFAYVDYTTMISPRTQAVDGYKYKTGYINADDTGKYRYYYFTGGYATNTIIEIDGIEYEVGDDGYFILKSDETTEPDVKGVWQKEGSTWYYVNQEGTRLTGWITDEGKKYYLSSNGAMVTGWKLINDKWYYFNSSGAMATGWKQLKGTWYFLNDDGSMATGWKQVDGKWYYLNADGDMATGWKQVGGTWYYLNSSGSMATGWKQVGNKWYYLEDWGGMVTGWKLVDGKWYYLHKDGHMAAREYVGGYYLGRSGAWVK